MYECVLVISSHECLYGKGQGQFFYSGQVAHPVGAYPGFLSMKKLEV